MVQKYSGLEASGRGTRGRGGLPGRAAAEGLQLSVLLGPGWAAQSPQPQPSQARPSHLKGQLSRATPARNKAAWGLPQNELALPAPGGTL